MPLLEQAQPPVDRSASDRALELPRPAAASRSIGWWCILGALAVLYTCRFYTALENHVGYYGNSYKAIHPESFPGDHYVTGHQTTFLSLYYLAARLVGDWWLDDRLHFFLYIGLAFLALWSVDRLARLLGLDTAAERLAILALVLVPHHIKDNQADIVPWINGSATTVIQAMAMWLTVLLFEGRTRTSVWFSGLMGLVSIKNGWYPAAVAALFAFRERRGISWRRITAGVAVALVLGIAIFAWVHRGSDEQARLFDYAAVHTENSEANPFLERGIGNLIYAALVVGAMVIGAGSSTLTRRVRAFGAIALMTCFVGGLYYTYAPDALKVSLFQAFAVNRSTWWPQVVMSIVLACGALRLVRHPSRIVQWAGASVFLALYLLPYTEWFRWSVSRTLGLRLGVLASLMLAGLGLWWMRRRSQLGGNARPRFASLVLCGPLLLASLLHLGYGIRTRWSALQFLAVHGIMGDSPGAKWVGINEYIREHTPPTAAILPLVMRDYPWRPEGLRPDGSLKIRTGRSMPVGSQIAFYFDYPKQLWAESQERHQWALVAAWQQHDWRTVAGHLQALGSPDYLIVPVQQGGWLQQIVGCPYHLQTTINGFGIWQR